MILLKITTISAVFLSAVFLVDVNCKAIAGRALLAPEHLGDVGSKQFFVIDGLVSWQTANMQCRSFGMNLVTIKSEAEWEFIRQQLMVEDKGPFWLGARDVAKTSAFLWSEDYGTPIENGPETVIDSFVGYYNWVEQGPMALLMNKNVGGMTSGAHSFSEAAKTFCQIVS